MGCASSKRVDVAMDVYRPAPTSFAVFDINTIKEPWVMTADDGEVGDDDNDKDQPEKPVHVPSPILEKLDTMEDAPRTWDEVSKALEDIKPTLNNPAPPPGALAKPKPVPLDKPAEDSEDVPVKKVKRKSFSFHTLDELDKKTTSKPIEFKRAESVNESREPKVELSKAKSGLKKIEKIGVNQSEIGFLPPSSEGYKSLKENPFLVRDRLESEREGRVPNFLKFNPLADYQEKCPPRGADSVVIYTTSLGGVRRTYEDCNQVRSIMELHGFVFEERDVSLHGEFLSELKELVGEGASCVPRMFIKGRYIGGVDEVMQLNEMGRLRRILSRAGIKRMAGRQVCEGCGGMRFVPCLDCGGSCKVVVDDKKERCPECNENGLIYCPICS